MRAGRGQRVQQSLLPAAGHRGPHAQAPARAGGHTVAWQGQQQLQQLHGGVVGEVQVVQRQQRYRVAGMAQQGHHRLHQGRLARQRLAAGPFGQQGCEGPAQTRVGRTGHAVHHLAQGTCQGCVGHQVVARPPAGVQKAWLRRGQGLQQARLAHASLAQHDHDMAGGQTLLQRGELGVAPDQARRPQHRCRHRRPRRRGAGQRGGTLDGRQQGQRGRRRSCADLVLEQLFALVEGQHGGRTIAAQVVQPHDPPMGILRQRLGLQQLQRQRQCAGGVAGGFQQLDAVFQGLACLRLAGTAAGSEPGVELGAFGRLPIGQQARSLIEIVPDVRCQLQGRGTVDQLGAGQLAQAKQALAKCVARGFGGAVRPQQCGQMFARTGAFQSQPGQQQGIGGGECARVALDHGVGRARKLQVDGRRRHVPQDRGSVPPPGRPAAGDGDGRCQRDAATGSRDIRSARSESCSLLSGRTTLRMRG